MKTTKTAMAEHTPQVKKYLEGLIVDDRINVSQMCKRLHMSPAIGNKILNNLIVDGLVYENGTGKHLCFRKAAEPVTLGLPLSHSIDGGGDRAGSIPEPKKAEPKPKPNGAAKPGPVIELPPRIRTVPIDKGFAWREFWVGFSAGLNLVMIFIVLRIIITG